MQRARADWPRALWPWSFTVHLARACSNQRAKVSEGLGQNGPLLGTKKEPFWRQVLGTVFKWFLGKFYIDLGTILGSKCSQALNCRSPFGASGLERKTNSPPEIHKKSIGFSSACFMCFGSLVGWILVGKRGPKLEQNGIKKGVGKRVFFGGGNPEKYRIWWSRGALISKILVIFNYI